MTIPLVLPLGSKRWKLGRSSKPVPPPPAAGCQCFRGPWTIAASGVPFPVGLSQITTPASSLFPSLRSITNSTLSLDLRSNNSSLSLFLKISYIRNILTSPRPAQRALSNKSRLIPACDKRPSVNRANGESDSSTTDLAPVRTGSLQLAPATCNHQVRRHGRLSPGHRAPARSP